MIDKVSNKFNTIAYVRPTEKCNLRCKHCFIPPNPSSMSDEQILDIPLQLSSAGVSGDVLLQWHGGEPLLIDPFRVEELIVELTSIVYATGINFLYGVQTNLVVLKNFSKKKRDKWYQVLSTYFESDLIGVSWDDSIRGINSKIQHFYGDFEQSIYAMRASQFFKDDFSPVVTITAAKPFLKANLKLAECMVFFRWLDYMQLHKIHIEKLTPTGDAIKNWKEIGVSNLEYSKTMSKIFLSYKRYRDLNPESKLAISPFCDLEDAIATGKQDNICASGACQTSMFTFSSTGMTKTCTAIAEHDEFNLKEYQNNVQANCFDCEFNKICNGGCPAHNNIVDVSGECSGAYHLLRTIKSLNKKGEVQ
ncbi:hypothetical protein BSPLISOX_1944 [uncultured Gammaproteobacteria bacterium]|jgi:radical SAM protein with 4Fe4S-binding SPASM domain|nr:hypothetical protein BSPLISOX_1944 [uncultured Gammaproteobacteria bacterium]